ncbi:MAG: arginase, partial [Actinomycetota bacterium]|nr:arginase [Actinomycetota bacterium]
MGPSAMRYADLEGLLTRIGVEVEDYGNVSAQIPEVASVVDEHARYLQEILATCAQLARRVQEIAERDEMPLVLGGDHSIAIGTLAGLHAAFGTGGVLWVDAHGDLNRPETSPSGNVHGMPLATALDECGFKLEDFAAPPWLDPKRVVLVGTRQLDAGEKQLIRELGLTVFTMADIDRRGVADVMRDAVEVVRG